MGNTENNQASRARADAENSGAAGMTTSGAGADPEGAKRLEEMSGAGGLGEIARLNKERRDKKKAADEMEAKKLRTGVVDKAMDKVSGS